MGDAAEGEIERALEETGRDAERERSKISFPYLDLDDAIEIVKTVYRLREQSCEWEQLGARFGVSAKGAGFRMRVLTAKLFGLVTYDRSTVTLTEIGIRATQASREKSARVDAFLHVPLFRHIYEKFKDAPLPDAATLEALMVSSGVANKVKDKALDIFRRSAAQAGFFDRLPDRLTMPISTAGGRRAGDAENSQQGSSRSSSSVAAASGASVPAIHPAMEGLLKALPPNESCWDIEKRAKWLQAAVNIFDLIYTASDHSKTISIHIK